MQNEIKQLQWSYDSMMRSSQHDEFMDDEGNNMLIGHNIKDEFILGDYRKELKIGLVNIAINSEDDSPEELSDMEITNQQQQNDGLDDLESFDDFRELVKYYSKYIAKGNDFIIALSYNLNLGVFSCKSVVYNGSFMSKDIITTVDKDDNFKAVL